MVAVEVCEGMLPEPEKKLIVTQNLEGTPMSELERSFIPQENTPDTRRKY